MSETATTPRTTCKRCGERRECRQARRHAGGNYRRAGSSQGTNVCRECAITLLSALTEGHQSVERWSAVSLQIVWGLTVRIPSSESFA